MCVVVSRRSLVYEKNACVAGSRVNSAGATYMHNATPAMWRAIEIVLVPATPSPPGLPPVLPPYFFGPATTLPSTLWPDQPALSGSAASALEPGFMRSQPAGRLRSRQPRPRTRPWPAWSRPFRQPPARWSWRKRYRTLCRLRPRCPPQCRRAGAKACR